MVVVKVMLYQPDSVLVVEKNVRKPFLIMLEISVKDVADIGSVTVSSSSTCSLRSRSMKRNVGNCKVCSLKISHLSKVRISAQLVLFCNSLNGGYSADCFNQAFTIWGWILALTLKQRGRPHQISEVPIDGLYAVSMRHHIILLYEQ